MSRLYGRAFDVYQMSRHLGEISLPKYREDNKKVSASDLVNSTEVLTSIKIDSLGNNYKIEPIKGFKAPMENNVPMLPSEIYEIYHSSIGDAAACIIYVLTDKAGRVNRVMSRYEYEKQEELK